MFTEKLSEYYTKLEDKYFNALDFLDEKGVPVYTYSDFFEEKGIPSFIVTVVIAILLIAMIAVAVSGGLQGANTVQLQLKDDEGNSLNNVMVAAYDQEGNLIKEAELKSDGDTLDLPNLTPGTRLRLVATKTDYGDDTYDIMLGQETPKAVLSLSRSIEGIKAEVEVIDSETGTRVNGATVFVLWKEKQFQLEQDLNGTYKKSNIPEGVTVTIIGSAEGYNDFEEQIIFYEGSVRTLSMTPSTQGYVGNASVLISVMNENGNVIDDALVSIYNKENEVVLLENVTAQGTVSGQIQTGIPLRIVVEKDGYLTYDSDVESGSITLREAEKQIEVTMKQGGEKLVVTTTNTLGLALDEVLVQIHRMDGEVFDSAYSTMEGAEFTGIDPSEEIIITAWKEGYIPQRKIVNVSATEQVDFLLDATAAGNSVRLDVFTTDNLGNSVNNAKVRLYDYDIDGNMLPTGIVAETNIGGFVPVVVPTQKTFLVDAETEIMKGNSSVEALEDESIPVYVRMTKKPQIIELVMTDVRGRQVFGDAVVDGLDGINLFDGNIQNSKIFFNAEGRETVELSIMMEDGNVFTENVYVKNKDTVEVVVYNKESDELAPHIEFIGLENEQGEDVSGITPGAFYWAKFSVAFPVQAESGGIHLRTGNDAVEFVDSDKIALYEISLSGADTFYSFSYTPNPSPGNEVIDRSNESLQGEESKWGEAILKQPQGTYTAKVKIRVSDFTAGTVPIHYRAWAEVQDNYYRMPSDADLGRSVYSENKSGLYAESLLEQLQLYESLPECSDNLCVTTNIVDPEENFYDIESFEGLTGGVYALELELSAQEAEFIQANMTASENIKFISTQVGSVTEFVSEGTESETAGTSISLNSNSKQKVRFYFVAKTAGTATINMSLAGETFIEKDLIFKIADEKELIVELSSNNVILGRNFTVKVLDRGLKGVENALVKIIGKDGKVVKSVSGDGGDGRGRNGNYRVENNLDTGLYTVEVTAPKSKTEVVPLLITTQDVLTFTDEIEVKMAFNEMSTIQTEELTNNSEFNITKISYEAEDSDDFEVSVNVPPALANSQSTNIPITIKYKGGISDTADETITLKISGYVEGEFFTTVSTQIRAIYNRKLDPSCLKIEPNNLTINLLGSAGSTDSDTFEVTNNCEQVLYLKNRVKENSKKSYVIVRSQDISLQPGETQNITVTANNLIDRQFSRDDTFNYDIVYDANYLKTTLPVKVRTVNPSYALSYPGHITMFLAQNSSGAKATAAQPLFVTNVSDFTVEGIEFSIDKSYTSSSGITLRVEPPGAVNLQKRQSITPPKYLFAQGSTTTSEPAKAQVLIKGQVANLNNNSGQRDGYDYYENYYNGDQSVSNYRPQKKGYSTATQTLGQIDVTMYYSGFDCLTVSATDDLTYNLSNIAAPITKKISITNNCAEPIRITGATSRTPELFVGLTPATVLQPNQGIEARLTVSALKDALRLTGHPIEVTAVTELSQVPLTTRALPIDVTVGADLESEYSKVLKGISVNVCGQDEKANVDIPKLASGKDCAEGYCDAEHAAEYIAEKLDNIQRKAVAQGYSKQNLSENFGCGGKNYCTFNEMGVETDKFDLYLMSDRVSTEAISAALGGNSGTTTSGFKGGTASTSSFYIEPFDVTTETIAFLAGGGYQNRIFFDNDIGGCGYYKIAIEGAYNVFGGTIQFDSPIIVVRAQDFEGNPRIKTKECTTNIINLQNHVPIDKSYNIGDSHGSWLTSIESESMLDNIAKKIAKSYLDDEDRHSNSGPGNKIKLSQGALEGARAEICIGGGEKKTISVKVNSEFSGLGGIEKENYETFVAKMVSEALKGDVGGTNCFTSGADGYDCLRLTDLSGVAPLAMKIPNKTMNLDSTSGCVPATIVSSASETVEFQVSKGERFIGVSKIEVKDVNASGGTVYHRAEYDGKRFIVSESESIKLQRGDAKNEPYSAEVLICAYSDSSKTGTGEVAYLQAHDSSFTVIAINPQGGRKTTDEDGKIKISVGTLHPNDLIERLEPPTKLAKGKEDPYYFTIMWAGDPDAISFDEYVEGMKRLRNLDNVVWDTEDSGKAGTEAYSTLEKKGKTKALGWYFGSCAVTSGVCNAGTGVIGAGLNALADCGIPAVTIFRTDLVQALPQLEGTYDFIGNLIPFTAVNSDPNYEPASWKPISVGAGAGGVKRIFSTATPRLWNGIHSGNIGWAADQVEDAYTASTRATLTNALENSSSDSVKSVIDRLSKRTGETVRTQFEKNLKKTYESEFKRTGVINRKYTNAHIDFTDAADKALREANGSRQLSEILTSRVDPTDATSARWIDELAPNKQTAEELLTVFKGDTAATIAKMRKFQSGGLETKLSERLAALTKNKTGKITKADMDSVLQRYLSDEFPEMTQQVRGSIVDDATSSFSEVSWKKRAEIPDTRSIIDDISGKTRSSFEIRAKNYANLTKSQIDDAGRNIADDIIEQTRKSGDDFAEIMGKPNKFKSLLKSGKFWRGLGWGVMCGAVSNAAGMYAYNKSIGTTAKDIEAKSASNPDPNFVFIKGETYKLVVSNNEIGEKVVPLFSEINEEGKAEMLEYLANEENEDRRLISKENKEGNTPAERKLQLYLLTSDPTTAEREMKKDKDRFTDNIINTKINILLKNDVQLLIQKYSATTVLGKGNQKVENKELIDYKGNPAPEYVVIATVLEAFEQQDFGGQEAITKELNGKAGADYIKSRVEKTLEIMYEDSLTAERAEEVFPGSGENFSQNVSMWKLIYDTSPK